MDAAKLEAAKQVFEAMVEHYSSHGIKKYEKQADEQNGIFRMKFDYIYLDPPYALEPYDKAMSKILQYDLLEEDGIIIAESARDTEIQAEGYVCYKEAKYGVARIRYFRKGEE